MSKQEFMKELESLLSDIPLEEREEALRYYDGYFEDAGKEHEDEIIRELGSPAKVARIIKAELLAGAGEGKSTGYFTERVYKEADELEDKYELVKPDKHAGQNGYAGSNQSGYGQTQPESRNSNRGLLILIAVCTSFIWAPLLLGVAGVLLGIVMTILGILFSFGAVGVCLMITGIALCISGLVQLSIPAIGAAFIGGGLIILGIGMLLTLAFIVVCKKLLPAMIRAIVDLCSKPFKKRRVMA
ncbi:MAG: DUF1700 domain-containing protein [Clostridiales bacterium]|nr:DUF1700 domain-containing protein [Clostridiales bacterium]